jgi:hypothetical protein
MSSFFNKIGLIMPTEERKKQDARKMLKSLDLAGNSKPPSCFTKPFAAKILLLIRNGAFYRDACFALGVDAITMIKWLQDEVEFARDVIKYRYQAIVNEQQALWKAGISGDLQSILLFLKAIEYDNEWLSNKTGQHIASLDGGKWDVKRLEKQSEDEPDKIIFVDRILEEEKN